MYNLATALALVINSCIWPYLFIDRLLYYMYSFATGSTVMVVDAMTASHKDLLTEPFNFNFSTLFTLLTFFAKININR